MLEMFVPKSSNPLVFPRRPEINSESQDSQLEPSVRNLIMPTIGAKRKESASALTWVHYVHSFCWLLSNGFWRFATHPGAARGNPKGPENPDVTTAIWLRQGLLNITPKRQRFTMYTAMHNFVPLTWSIQSGKYSGQIKAWHLKMGWDETQTRTISNSLVSNEQLGIIYIWMDASFPTTLKSSHLLQ